MKNKRGSSTILLAMIITAFMSCIASAISLSRSLVVKSECECFSRLWARAVLSEYDLHLLEDYGIMAFYGSERLVNEKLDYFQTYSCSGKLDARIGKASSALGEYVLSEPENFRQAMKKSFVSDAAESSLKRKKRVKREAPSSHETRIIANQVVLDTLPSNGLSSSVDASSLSRSIEKKAGNESVLSAAGDTAVQMAYIRNHFSNYLYENRSEKCYFGNEWEYIICGKKDDSKNYEECRNKLFVIRNALNLVSIYKEPELTAAIAEIAELITPGPAGLVTQAVITEAWAAAETEEDLRILYDGGRVALLKKIADWKIGLGSVINSDKVKKNIDKEAREKLDENADEISRKIEDISGLKSELSEGQTYEDYLTIMMLALNENVRVLRIMDLIQINMKFRYYADFNMDEYYVGAVIGLDANGRAYEAEEKYK